MTGFHVKKSIKQRAQAVVRSFVGGSSKYETITCATLSFGHTTRTDASLACRQDNTLYIMLLGETGSGKSTLLNMLVNFFRAKEEARTRLPTVKELKVAVPTAHLNATEAEGAGHSERDKTDSKLDIGPLVRSKSSCTGAQSCFFCRGQVAEYKVHRIHL